MASLGEVSQRRPLKEVQTWERTIRKAGKKRRDTRQWKSQTGPRDIAHKGSEKKELGPTIIKHKAQP